MISMVVLTFARGRIAEQLLASLTDFDREYIDEIIIVDNNCDPVWTTQDITDFGISHVVSEKVNLGVAGGRNKALDHVTNNFVLYVDDDCILGDLSKVYELVETEVDFGLINIQVEDEKGEYRSNEVPRPKKFAYQNKYICLEKVGYVIGACFIVSPEFSRQRFYTYFNPYGYEEIEYSMRALSNGVEIHSLISSGTKHLKNSSGRNVSEVKHLIEKRFYIVGKYYPLINQILALFILVIQRPLMFRVIISSFHLGYKQRDVLSSSRIEEYFRKIGLRYRMF